MLAPSGRRFITAPFGSSLLLVATLVGALHHPAPTQAQDPPSGPTKIWSRVGSDTSGSISRDGRYLTYTDWDCCNLALRDLTTGHSRLLTDRPPPEFAYPSSISPDSKWIAFGWKTEDGGRDLRIIGIDGKQMRTLYRSPDVEYFETLEWSPSKQRLACTLVRPDGTREIALISTEGGSAEVLRRLGATNDPQAIRFSPDGRFLAYDYAQDERSSNKDIFVLPLTGGEPARVVRDAGDATLLAWLPDSSGLLYASEFAGGSVWSLPVQNPAVSGKPRQLVAGIGPVSSALGLTDSGSLFYGVLNSDMRLYTGTVEPGSPLELVADSLAYDSAADWSPDGGHLSFVTARSDDAYSFALNLLGNDGHRTSLSIALNRFGGHAFQPRWSPDGDSLIVQADAPLERGIFRIDAVSGKTNPLALIEEQGLTGILEWPVWVDSETIAYTRWREPWPARDIVIQDLSTGDQRVIYPAEASRGIAHLAASPDGQHLAFFEWDAEERTLWLQVMPASGSASRTLQTLPPPVMSPYGQPLAALAWTPDSSALIYSASAAEIQQPLSLWKVSPESGEPKDLGPIPEGLLPYSISVHPDGRRIALTAGTKPHSEVRAIEHLIPVSGGNPAGTETVKP